MVDYLESLERLAMPDELHIKECEKLGISLTEDYEVVERALLELESIKEAKPSEALKCLENLFSNVVSTTYNRESSLKDFNTVKQALIKEQEQKQYLKWEDLDFSDETKVLKVKMGDTIYKIAYRCYGKVEEVQLLSEDEKLLYFSFIGRYKDNVQLFNDLNLEVLE